MTPGARVAAAIDILDAIASGQAAEPALSRWARSSRFAGSKDRAAVRDHVYDALRTWRSSAAWGGGDSGRARMIGHLRQQGQDVDALFHGAGHAPEVLTDAERAAGGRPEARGDLWDLPDWLLSRFSADLGADAAATAQALTQRAPVTVRVNISKAPPAQLRQTLADEGIETILNPRAATALTVTSGARRIRQSPVFEQGMIELQDAASQAAILGIPGQGRALDFCAGGGGKALALAAQGWDVTAHDIDTARMRDLPPRAARGGHDIALCLPDQLPQAGLFDLVLCDAPCSGAGTWRRTPEAKWALTPDRLAQLEQMQRDVLAAASPHVAPGGRLVYATCSILRSENEDQVARFTQENSDWTLTHQQRWPVDAWGDGFFVAHLTRTGAGATT
ncbi:MAG: RsmB/NOP family class I SAM-dependent RNA methyltransferase [Pseudomonadota bacterium]